MRCARSLLQGAAQGKTNNMVRRQLKLPTIVSWLSAQRLHWLQVMMREPNRHAVVLAALAGRTVWENSSQLTITGSPSSDANPWLKMFWQDICKCMIHCPQLRAQLASQGWYALPCSLCFLCFPVCKLHSYIFDGLEFSHARRHVNPAVDDIEPEPAWDPRLPH
eukprot:14416490-Heterocapsa_arctica.AAC.2